MVWLSLQESIPVVPIPTLDGTVLQEEISLSASVIERGGHKIYYEKSPFTIARDRLDETTEHIMVKIGPEFGLPGKVHPLDLILGRRYFHRCSQNNKKAQEVWFYVYKKDLSENETGFVPERFGISPCAPWKGDFPQYPSLIGDMIEVEEGDLIYVAMKDTEFDAFDGRGELPRIELSSFNACEPIICPDETTRSSCDPDDNPLNYLVDPCDANVYQCNDGVDNDGDGGIDLFDDLVVTQVNGGTVTSKRTCGFGAPCDRYLHLGLIDQNLYMLGDELFDKTDHGWLHVIDFDEGVFNENRLELPREPEVHVSGNPFNRGPVDMQRKMLYISYSAHPANPSAAHIYKVDVSGELPEIVGTFVADEFEKMIRLDMQMTHDGRFLYALVENRATTTTRYVKIDTNSMSIVSAIENVEFHLPWDWVNRSTLGADGEWAYMVRDQKIVRIDLNDFSVEQESAQLSSPVHQILPAGDSVVVSMAKTSANVSMLELRTFNATTLVEEGRYVIDGTKVIGGFTFDRFHFNHVYTDALDHVIAYIQPCSSSGRCGNDEDEYMLMFEFTDGELQLIEEQHPIEYDVYTLLTEPHGALVYVDKDLPFEERGFAHLDFESSSVGDVHSFKTEFDQYWGEYVHHDGGSSTFTTMKRLGDTMYFYPPFFVHMGDAQCTSPEQNES